MALPRKQCKRCENSNCGLFKKKLFTREEKCSCGLELKPCASGSRKIMGLLLLMASLGGSVVYCIGYQGNNADNKAWSEQIILKDQTIGELKVSNRDKTEQIVALQEKMQDLAKLVSELEQNNASLNKKNQEQHQRIGELEQDKGGLKKKDQEQHHWISELEQDNASLKKKNQEQRQQIDEFERENANLKQVKQENKQLKSRVAELENINKLLGQKRQVKSSSLVKECHIENTDFSYQGDCQNNLPDGWGTMKFSNGERYEGQFKKGQRDGCGTHTFPDGEKMENQLWKRGKLTGKTCKNS